MTEHATQEEMISIIRTLEQRAKVRRWEAYGVLAVMFVLLGLGGLVFVYAKDITAKETGAKTQSLQLQLQQRRAKAADTLWDSSRHVQEIASLGGEVLRQDRYAGPAKFHIDLCDSGGRVRQLKEVADELANDSKRTGYKFIDYELRLNGIAIPSLRLRVTPESIERLGHSAWPSAEDLQDEIRRLKPLAHEVDVTENAMNELESQGRSREVLGLLGEEAEQGDRSLSIPFLVQLNITRFGTISLIALGIGILAPLYRFNARLSAFYQARSDALRLHQIGYKQTSILKIIDSLTPQFDFGKTVAPDERMFDLLKSLTKDTKGE